MLARLLRGTTVVVALLGCGTADEPTPAGAAPVRLPQPPSPPPGWSLAEGPIEYLPGTLYEYLDGGAHRYLGYGFRGLVHSRFQLGDEVLASVTLDLYDMGGELGAFGIYSSGRPPHAELRDWGVEGYRSGNVAAAWKGAFFFTVRPTMIAPSLSGCSSG